MCRGSVKHETDPALVPASEFAHWKEGRSRFMGPQSDQLLASDPADNAPFHSVRSVFADQSGDPCKMAFCRGSLASSDDWARKLSSLGATARQLQLVVVSCIRRGMRSTASGQDHNGQCGNRLSQLATAFKQQHPCAGFISMMLNPTQ